MKYGGVGYLIYSHRLKLARVLTRDLFEIDEALTIVVVV